MRNYFFTRLLLLSGLLFSANPFARANEIHFSRARVKIGTAELNVELAQSSEQLEHGLMFRKAMPENEGMLFIYKKEMALSFWMKNTFLPLSIGFFNAKKELIDMQDMEPMKSEIQARIPTYESKGEAQYALEVNQGWFKRHGIKINTKFSIEK